jgi:hypothetical protein
MRRLWTDTEQRQLRDLAAHGCQARDIAPRVGWSVASTRRKIRKLHLRLRANRQGHAAEWSHNDIAALMDLVADGYPRPTIAARLRRTPDAITAMVKKLRLRTRRSIRGVRHQFHVKLLDDAYRTLAKFAAERQVPLSTFCTIILDLSARWPTYLELLLDDSAELRHADDAPSLLEEEARPHSLGSASPNEAIYVSVESYASAVSSCYLIGCVARPELAGQMH